MSDLVARGDVLDALIEKGQNSKRYKWGESWELNLSEIKEAVESIPSAEPERKKGKWIPDGKQMIINLENAREQYKVLGYPHRNILRLKCSECRILTLVDESIRYDYCPHCGAEMTGCE